MFNIQLFRNNLLAKDFGKHILYYDEINSTNSKAWELVSEEVENGTVIITDNQTSGRGRQSNKWFSEKGKSLTFSIILYPSVVPKIINLYSLIAGLAITDALKINIIKAKLKWPNDILINDKKIGGILCESKLSGGKIKSLVIGMGLNVNNSIEAFPKDLNNTATSIFIENGGQVQIEILLTQILFHLEKRLQTINSSTVIISEWEDQCAHLNKKISFHNSNKIIKGIFNGLTNLGEAIIETDGKRNNYNSGEILL